MTEQIATSAAFNLRAQKQNGYYNGPKIEDGLEPVIEHLDAHSEFKLVKSVNGSIRMQFEFREGLEVLKAEMAFIRKPDDWGDGHDHHLIGSVCVGCTHGCSMCVDGIPKSWKADFSPEQQAYMQRKTLEAANEIEPIAPNAKIKLLLTGSGDPFAAAHNMVRLAPALREVDDRLVTMYASTAGAIRNMDLMVETAHKAKENGVRVDSQFSVHTFDPEKRRVLIPNPNIHPVTLAQSAQEFHERTENTAYINYMVVPGWNDSDVDAALIAQHVGEGCTLKLVEFNDTGAIEGFKLPEFLQGKKCSRADVENLQAKVITKMRELGRNFEIITPEDRAYEVDAACGTVAADISLNRAAAAGITLIQIKPAPPAYN